MKPAVEALVSGVPNLGSYAAILEEVEEILHNPQTTLTTVGEVIEKDPDLTARLLKLGNSSFFGFGSRIETVSETISLIGLRQVQDLIAVVSVVKVFDGVPPDLVCMESFWKHSLACGMAARLLALARRLPKPEKHFVAGLLHDVGRLVLYLRAPQSAREVFQHFAARGGLLRQAEQQVLGFDHAEIGEALLRAWNYPPTLVNAVRYHHQPMSAGPSQLETSLIHVADALVNAMQWGSSGERYVPALDLKAWQRLALPLDTLESTMGTVDAQISEVEGAFLCPEADRSCTP
jgi:putative nucleotidyltransferase with HDIG domain